MQRMNLRRIGGAVAAVVAGMALASADAIDALARDVSRPALDRAPGVNQLKVDVMGNGLAAIIGGHRNAWLPVVATAPFAPQQAVHCAFEQAIGQRVCQSRNASDSVTLSRAITYRTYAGATQELFDAMLTDTVTLHTAFVNSGVDAAARPLTSALRSTQHFTGTSRASAVRTLNGADTVFTTRHWSASARLETRKVVTYSNVTMSNDRFTLYPSDGVVYVSTVSTSHNTRGTSDHYTSMIVHFDGTATPEAYINGVRYRLELESGIATPLNGA
jgi:hypothetical protein